MATLRPYKQLPLLPLVSVSPRGPRVLNTLSGGNSLRTPSSCRLLPRHAAPYPPPSPGSKHSRARAPRRVRRGARLGAPAEAPGAPGEPSPAGTSLPPYPLHRHTFPSGLLRVVDGSWDAACGAEAKAASGLDSGTACLGFSFPLWVVSGTSARFCGLSRSPDPDCRVVPTGRSNSPMPPAA